MLLKNAPFNNVNPNQTATLDLLAIIRGRCIDRVILLLGGTVFTKLQILDIRVRFNGKIIWQDTGDRTDKRNQYRGLSAAASLLTVDFTEIRAKLLLDQKLGSIDTSRLGDKDTLTMEVDVGGATAPTLVAYTECSWQTTQVEQGVDLIGKVLNFPHQINATANKYPINIPFGSQGGSLIKRIHLVPPAAGITINAFEVRKNGATIYDSVQAVNDFINAEYQRVKQTGWFHCDFINDGNFLGNVLDAANAQTMEYYADVTVTVAGLVQVIVEMLDTLANN